MKKLLFIVMTIISVISISAYFIINNIDINKIVKQQIEQQGTKLTGKNVVVETVDINLSQGIGSINNLKILNPKNHKYENIFTIDEVKLDIDISSITNSVKTINNIEINGINVFVYLDKNGKINLSELQQHIKNKLQKSQPKTTKNNNQIKTTKDKKYDPNIVVKKVALQNIKIHLDLTSVNKKTYKITLQQVKIYNIGEKTGFPASKIGGIIINELSKKILQDIKIRQEQIIKNKLKKEIKRGLKNALKKLF